VNAKRRVERVRDLLAQIGLEPERVRMFNMSSAMAGEFAKAATEMSEQITELGPSPLRDKEVEKHVTEING
jgi:F420-non-reducing hydrogenase iron-sulfur subunit